jgi:hypothetical protein
VRVGPGHLVGDAVGFTFQWIVDGADPEFRLNGTEELPSRKSFRSTGEESQNLSRGALLNFPWAGFVTGLLLVPRHEAHDRLIADRRLEGTARGGRRLTGLPRRGALERRWHRPDTGRGKHSRTLPRKAAFPPQAPNQGPETTRPETTRPETTRGGHRRSRASLAAAVGIQHRPIIRLVRGRCRVSAS